MRTVSNNKGEKMTNKNEQEKPLIYIEDARNQKILESISKRFTLKGLPIKVTSKNNVKYNWLQESKLLENSLDIFKFVVDFIAYEMPEMHETFNPVRASLVGMAIIDMIREYGYFSDDFDVVVDGENEDITKNEVSKEKGRAQNGRN